MSQDGGTGTASLSYTVAGAPTAQITSPRPGARYAAGQTVRARYSCAEGASGPGIKSCTGPVRSGAKLNTSIPGRHSFRVTAVSRDGQRVTKTVRYAVRTPSNHLVSSPQLTAFRDGRFVVVARVPGPGRVDIMITAWNDNIAHGVRLLQPAPGRFVFARATAIASRGMTLRVQIKPNARGLLLLQRPRYRVTLRLWVTYTPRHGHPRNIGFYGLHLPS
jgi:hypothetical protein